MGKTGVVTALAVALCAMPASAGADFTTNVRVRAKLAARLDAAGRSADHTQSAGISQQSLNGLPSVVITRNTTIEELSRELPRLVRETHPGAWEIHRTIFVVNHATLSLQAPRVREIRLISSPGAFASLIGYNGSLSIRGGLGRKLLVHSWNPARRAPDNVLRDGRATVSVRRKGRLDAFNVAFEDLGFYEGRVSGVAVTSPRSLSPASGSFFRSRFARNAFGAYTYHARGVKWVGNEFVHNRVYGLDPHDDSDGFLVEGNYAAHNGRHGIIFSRSCDGNIIRRNIVEYNRWHGIVLDDGKRADGPSNGNRVYGNVVRGNVRVGISVDGSSRNTIHDNQISGSLFGVRLFGPSRHNRVLANAINNARDAAIFVDRPSADSSVRANLVVGSPTGVRIRGAPRTLITHNQITRATSHGVKVDGDEQWKAVGSVIKDNTIRGKGPSPILVSTAPDDRIEVGPNTETWNYPLNHDLARVLAWAVGPGLWLVLFGVALCGGLLFAAREQLGRWLRRISLNSRSDHTIHAKEVPRSQASDLAVYIDDSRSCDSASPNESQPRPASVPIHRAPATIGITRAARYGVKTDVRNGRSLWTEVIESLIRTLRQYVVPLGESNGGKSRSTRSSYHLYEAHNGNGQAEKTEASTLRTPVKVKQLNLAPEEVTCDVCRRTLLKGEIGKPFLAPTGQRGRKPERKLVCEPCWASAGNEWWASIGAEARGDL